MVTLGFLVLNRYDLLENAIKSAEAGLLKPDKYLIIDNGGGFRMNDFYTALGDRLDLISPPYNLGVAGGWNEIIKNSEDIRIIANDDVKFFDDTIKLLVENFSENKVTYPGGIPSANSFSCYLIPTAVVSRIGYFDEAISPHYGYFEDNDYHRRMQFAGIPLEGIPDCRLAHEVSSTMKVYTETEIKKHHDRFRRAERNYITKWGGKPGYEKYVIPKNL
jgi:GT2 family glycosyltransferase